ncbi:MAG: ABC transporter permease, partial [Bacteroidota bacterium]
ILCVIGGAMGLLFVWGITSALSAAIPFQIYLSFNNAALGVGLSIIIGLIAGVVPAALAAGMDPVEAMRS